MREFSLPPAVEVPASASLSDVVFDNGEKTPDKVALSRKTDAGWQDVTAAQFRDEVRRVAKGLAAAGIGPGDRVGLLSRTRYEWTLIDYAIWAAGAVTVPLYETSSAEQIRWILGDSEARAVFVETADNERAVGEMRADLPALREVWRIEDNAVDKLVSAGESLSDDVIADRRQSVGADDLATIIYTSGTTGPPKGCALTHGNLLSDVRNSTQGPLRDLFVLGNASTLLFLPLAHVFARIIQVGCIESGVRLGHSSNVQDVLPDLATFRPTFILAVPRVFEKVYNSAAQKAASEGKGKIFQAAAATAIAHSEALDKGGPGAMLRVRHAVFDRLVYAKLRAALGGNVVYAVSGGSALGERLGHFFRGIGVAVLEGYGMTETAAGATINGPDKLKIGTVGRPFPSTSIRIADDGEILMKGPNIFRGYWNNPKATEEVLDADGWLHSGDIGTLDEDGFLRITGRKKELLVTAGGKNVAPAVIEDRLRSHALVSQCMVVGDRRPYVACLVTLDEEALQHWSGQHGKSEHAVASELREDPDLVAEIQAAVDDANKAVSRAESVRRFRILSVDFTVDNGYITPSLKVKRNVVERDFAGEIEALYS